LILEHFSHIDSGFLLMKFEQNLSALPIILLLLACEQWFINEKLKNIFLLGDF
jgi:hypothetical protein